VTTVFYYSEQWQVLEERVGGQTTVQYVWSPVYVDAMVLRDRDSDGDGTLDERLWVVQDANYNVTAIFDNSGNVVERYIYDPFGQATVLDANWNVRSAGSAYDWLYLHQGGRYDVTSGLYHFRFRDYSPTLGRWTSLDPLSYAAGDDPINSLDPSGLVEQYVRNFWNSFTEEMKKFEILVAAKSFYHVHHTKPQYFRKLYTTRGINIDQAEHLVLVHPTVHEEICTIEKQWIENEMKKINPKWRYGNAKDKDAFLQAIMKDDAFFQRLEEFSRNQRVAYTDYFIPAGTSDKELIKRIYNNMDGAKKIIKFKASAAVRAKQLLPRAAGALAFLALIQPIELHAFGHTPEQQRAFDKFYTRYQGLFQGAIAGQTPDKLQLGLLKDEWIAYLQSIGVDNMVLAQVNRELELAIADK